MVRITIALSLTLVVLAAAAWGLGQRTSAGGPLYGDASCDGSVNSIDAAVVLQLSAGLLPSIGCPANGDANADGHTNSLDSALILQYAAGLITHLGPTGPMPTATPGPGKQCPDGYFWNPIKGHCDSTDCPPGLVWDPVAFYCVLATPQPGSTATPVGSVQYPVMYYQPTNPWHDTDIELHAGQRIVVHTTGSVIYDNGHLMGVSADGDGSPTGWGNCQDHSLIGWVGAARPAADAPVSLTNVVCLGVDFDGAVPAAGHLFININDRGHYADDVGQWFVTVKAYP